MSRESFIGHIEDEHLYSLEAIRRFMGKPAREARDWIREHCVHTEPWEGNVFVLGVDFKTAMVQSGKVDTPEAREKRLARSGASKRRKAAE